MTSGRIAPPKASLSPPTATALLGGLLELDSTTGRDCAFSTSNYRRRPRLPCSPGRFEHDSRIGREVAF